MKSIFEQKIEYAKLQAEKHNRMQRLIQTTEQTLQTIQKAVNHYIKDKTKTSGPLEIAIQGLNQEKEIITTNLAQLAHKGRYTGQTALRDRLREIDEEIRKLLEPKEVILPKGAEFISTNNQKEPCKNTHAKNADKPKAPTHSQPGATTENSATPAATASTQPAKRAESKKDN